MVDHILQLAEFCKGVELAGGTTPHVAMTVESMSRLHDPVEKLWFAGCYAMAYNWPMAERLFQEWPDEDFNQERFLGWLEQHWAGVFLRKERKAIFRKPFFAECAASYRAFALKAVAAESWPSSYLDAFAWMTGNCKYMGRYIAIRWLEVMRRAFPVECGTWTMSDVRSDGGEHPRKALALLYPEWAPELLGGNTRHEVQVADLAADTCLTDLRVSYGLDLGYYELQSLLCEYKQSWLGRKQYPGKSIDTEMDYFRKVSDYWDHDSSFYSVREACFPDWARGELNGWDGVRPELGWALSDYGLTWSDAIFKYEPGLDDIEENLWHPKLRDPAVTRLADLMT